MAEWKDTVMIDGKPVEVVIYAPGNVNIMNLQELSEKAWRSVNKEIEVGGIRVKVRAS